MKVELISGITKDDYVEWILEKSLQQDIPDVFMVPSESFDMFAQTGLLLNLESYMNEINEKALLGTVIAHYEPDNIKIVNMHCHLKVYPL